MEYVAYAFGVALRLAVLPLWLVRCIYVYLMAVYKEKGVRVYVDESRDFPGSDGTNNSPGSAGVDDTLSLKRDSLAKLSEIESLVHNINDVLGGYGADVEIIG